MKKKFLIIFSFLFAFRIFAYDGVMSGEKNLKVYKTQWFDIIYPESCVNSAALLAKNADEIYLEIAKNYNSEPYFRMPVVLTSKVQQFNAYFSEAPYNHIVLYVTRPSSDMNVFSQELLSTFKHELTHAFTFNHKNKFWKSMGKVFGDPVCLGAIHITTGIAEGATLTSESSNGEGRLNDGYSLQMIKQAKIENKIPAYHDVQGARDFYPQGSAYYFNGSFHQWLQDTYGMKKYAQFWYRLINFKNVTVQGAFKKVYKIKLKDAWNLFFDNVKIPDVVGNPITTDIAKDFFAPNDFEFSYENGVGAANEYLTASKKGLVYWNRNSSSVFFVSSAQNLQDKIAPKKLFSFPNIESLSQSYDGRFITINYYKADSATTLLKQAIYDAENKTWFYTNNSSSSQSLVFYANDSYFLVDSHYSDLHNSIRIFKLNMDSKNKIQNLEFVNEIVLQENCFPFDFVDFGDGRFAFLLSQNLENSICFADSTGKISTCVKIPNPESSQKNFAVRNLAKFDKGFAFSWATKDILPRIGFFDLTTNNFLFGTKDLSGGVHFPVDFGTSFSMEDFSSFDDGQSVSLENEVVFIGKFLENSSLLKSSYVLKDLKVVSSNLKDLDDLPNQFEISKEELKIETNSSKNELKSSKNYNPFSYMKRGIFIPFSLLDSKSYASGTELTYFLPFGFTYVSSNPWTSKIFNVSAGFGFETQSAKIEVGLISGTSTSLFNYNLSAASEFDLRGWKSAEMSAQFSSVLPVGRVSYFKFALESFASYGRPNRRPLTHNLADEFYAIFSPGSAVSSDMNHYLYNSDVFSVAFSTVRKSLSQRSSKAGFSISPFGFYTFNQKIGENPANYANKFDVGLTMLFYIPHLLPIKINQGRFTYNLPAKVALVFNPANYSMLFGGPREFVGSATFLAFNYGMPLVSYYGEVVLFAAEIQKAIPLFAAIYLNDIKISLIQRILFLEFGYSNEKSRIMNLSEYFDFEKWMCSGNLISIRTSIGLSPNIGPLASSSYKAYLYSEISASLLFFFSIGVDVSF